MRVPLVAIIFLIYATSSISALTSYFVAMVVSHQGDSYPKSDDSYLRNWLLRTHFVCGGNAFSSTHTFNCFTCICGGTLNSAEKKSRPSSCTL